MNGVEYKESWLPRVELTLHSQDRLSQRCLHIWLEQGNGVGFMSFFLEKSRHAYALVLRSIANQSISISHCKVDYEGVTYVFGTENGVTRLVTAYLVSNN